jgi:8-oxo-dGTP pyrophosphatase MutT (NUDIX family)
MDSLEHVWVTPGGGVEEGESDEQAVRRELLEETGLVDFELGSPLWTRTAHLPLGDGRWDGETERVYLVRTRSFEPSPRLGRDELRAEGVTAIRWWTVDELEAADVMFAPRSLPSLVGELVLSGPPGDVVEVGP